MGWEGLAGLRKQQSSALAQVMGTGLPLAAAPEQTNLTGAGAHREQSSLLRPAVRHSCSKSSAERSSDVLSAATNPLGTRDYSQTHR